MSPKRRREKILELVRHRGKASVEELAEVFSASRETIRRDLNALSETGILEKVHGGARVPRLRGEGSFDQRMAENTDAKRKIGHLGAELIKSGDTLFIDTGSTTLIYAQALAAKDNLKVVTNSALIARAVAAGNASAEVFLLGGAYYIDNQQTHGPMALAQAESFRANHAVITIGGIHSRNGLTDFNIAEAQVAVAMIDHSENLVVLADSSKFGRTGPFSVCPLERVGYLVTDTPPDGALKRALDAAETQVVC